jgi:GAF domain-containing protein
LHIADIAQLTDPPQVTARALELGFRAVLAEPIRLREQRIGGLNIVGERAGPFSDADAALARGLADMAAIGILNSRQLDAANANVRSLEHAIASRAVVEQAKALLADRLEVDTDSAFDLLRRHARNRNRKLRDIAERFVSGELDQGAFVDR